MSEENNQELAAPEQTNANEQTQILLNRIEALERKNKEILDEKKKLQKVDKTIQSLPEGVDVQALIDFKNKAEQQKLEEQGNYKEAIQKSEEQFRERSAAKDKEIAIIPDFKSSELTFGPTFSTLLKLKLFPKDLSKFILISSIIFLFSLFSNLIKKSVSLPKFLTETSPKSI